MPKRNLPDWFPGLRAIDQMDQKEGGRRKRRWGRREVVGEGGGGGWKGKKDSREEQRRKTWTRGDLPAMQSAAVAIITHSRTSNGWAGISALLSRRGRQLGKIQPSVTHTGMFFCFFCFFTAFPQSCCPHNLTWTFAKPQWLKEDKYIIGSNGAFLQFSSHSHWWEWSGNDDSLTRGFVNYPPTDRPFFITQHIGLLTQWRGLTLCLSIWVDVVCDLKGWLIRLDVTTLEGYVAKKI